MFKRGGEFCVVFAALWVGCAPAEVDQPSDVQGRPFDVLQQRVRFPEGDRFDRHMNGRFTGVHRQRPADPSRDWNYNIGAGVTSAVAIYNNAYSGGTPTAA